jgi:hypothetical protein
MESWMKTRRDLPDVFSILDSLPICVLVWPGSIVERPFGDRRGVYLASSCCGLTQDI